MTNADSRLEEFKVKTASLIFDPDNVDREVIALYNEKGLLTQLHKDILELIGEDEEWDGNPPQTGIEDIRNELRAELREKLNSYFNIKEEWETVADFTKIKKGGVPIDEVIDALEGE